MARAIGAGPFTPALGGNLVGFDFNPTVDRIRLVTSTGQNLRLNPETGTVANTDGAINGAAGATLTGVAYTNNTTKAATTILYDLDPVTDQLYRQDPPNDGALIAVGSLSLNITGNGGFDIDAKTGTALGLYAVNGNPTLFTVDLTTGAARPLAQYAASLDYSGIAIPTQPVMYAVGFITISGRSTVNYLYTFDPTQTSGSTTVGIGLARNEEIKGLDFRPATSQLYALVIGLGGRFLDGTIFNDSYRLYTIDLITGAATRVVDLSIPLPYSVRYAFDFDPVTDRIRIVAAGRQNLLVNPSNGTVTVEGDVTANVGGLAYDNSYAGATSTTLYAIGNNKLYIQNPPSAGTLTEIGTIGLNGFSTPVTINLFDIGGTTNTAYGFTIGGNNKNIVSSLDLATHTATYLRNLDLAGGPFVYAVAVAPGF
ncbi:DUF4394 domain-containing protein [Hymenobacter sp. HDW8]|nr:DUF4394 domain-containing protein [Hymenobacter sp. HDW8]